MRPFYNRSNGGCLIVTRQGEKGQGVFEIELANAQLALLAYVAKLLGGVQDARDVLQNTNLTLCRERRRYDASRPFLAWARTVAYFEVMSWRKRQSRSRLVFSDETVERMAETLACEDDPVDERLSLLELCKKRLPPLMRRLLDRYYGEGERLAVIAVQTGRTVGSLANSLYYVRNVLKLCVEEKLSHKGEPTV